MHCNSSRHQEQIHMQAQQTYVLVGELSVISADHFDLCKHSWHVGSPRLSIREFFLNVV